MYVVPINPNSISVPMISTGCCKSVFDPTYSVRLNGIITQDEYQQSIENINRASSSRTLTFICGIFFLICIVGGIGLFIAGGSIGASKGFPVLVGVGLGVFIFGIITFSVGCCLIQQRRANLMRQAIALESAKYSQRSPTPCSWRLHVTRIYRGRQGTRLIYRLVIDIGTPFGANGVNAPYQFNQMNPYPPPFVSQQYNMSPPLPNYNQSAAKFCSACGMVRQDPATHFCSSCGHSFG